MGKKKGPGAPLGNRNNPHGRPPTLDAVGKVFARLDAESLGLLEGLEGCWTCSRSDAIRRSIKESAERHGVKAKGK